MAYLLIEMERAAEAIPLCDRSLALDTFEDDDYATALNNKGFALLQLGIGGEAECYRQALTYDDITLEERIRAITCLLSATDSDAESASLLNELRGLAREHSDDDTVQWALGMALCEFANTRSASPEEAWTLYKELEEVAKPFRTSPKWKRADTQLSGVGL
jgi:tetratricopeptide (TPR) repeat protein